jgi:hypothetical protein
MELVRVGPSGQLGDQIELLEEFAHHVARVVALAQLLELSHDSRQGIFGPRDGHLGIVFALPFEAGVMLEKLFAIEIGETVTGRTEHGVRETRNVDACKTTFQGHFCRGISSVDSRWDAVNDRFHPVTAAQCIRPIR